MTQITEHLANIVERVARATEHARRAPQSVSIVAISKQQPAAAIAEAYRAGLRHFGESYVQEALPKMAELSDLDITWHFVGRLQANKTRPVAEHFSWVHTVDRLRIAERLNEQRPPFAAPLNVLIQVNQGGEEQKAGTSEADVAALARAILALPRLKLRGLMTLPPQDGENAGAWFASLAALRQRLVAGGIPLDTLSMGMSADFEAAIAAGADFVRIGTAIFGARGAT
ncbi:MAG TPA: YggS family pyridoxal phosphate-dependent enzyme [Gammaproteobacteria bacterium]|nr:YggS family pyridoxal phosphate-dependent enzyme [Gammaproteobacteria bacterium]